MVFISVLLVIISVLLNLFARFMNGFADIYKTVAFPYVSGLLCRYFNIFPFSFGEILLYTAVLLTFLLMVSIGLLISKKMRRYSVKYIKIYFLIFSFEMLVMTLNCFILYQVTHVGAEYSKDFTKEDISILRNDIVRRANKLSTEFNRDENGKIVLTEEYVRSLPERAEEAMLNLADLENMSALKGYYPKTKPLCWDTFFSKQYIMGYYFPFTMEANINFLMEPINYPATMCHELSHIKGYILEDEANFISYLACIYSGDKFMEYSAYISVLYYVDRDFFNSIGRDEDEYLKNDIISDYVKKDDVFLSEENWEKVNKSFGPDTETVHKVSNEFTNAVLKSNGVPDGMDSYSRVVLLLLGYYDREKNIYYE